MYDYDKWLIILYSYFNPFTMYHMCSQDAVHHLGPQFLPPASQLTAMQNAPPGIQQAHPARNSSRWPATKSYVLVNTDNSHWCPRHVSTFRGYAAYKRKTAVLATSQLAPLEIASIATACQSQPRSRLRKQLC
jgi:hypothetical protein